MVGVSDVNEAKDVVPGAANVPKKFDNSSLKGPKEVSFRQRPSIIDSLSKFKGQC